MKPRAHGVTLIELLVALSIFAILVLIGIPSFQQWLLNTRVRTAAESIQNGLRYARNEAAQRGTNVMFNLTNGNTPNWTVCLWTSGSSCPASGSSVLQVYTSANSATGVSITTSTAISAVAAYAYKNTISGAGGSIVFNALARPATYGNTSIVRVDAFTSSTNTSNIRRVVTMISPGGEVNMCDARTDVSFSAANPQVCQ
jgi:type IV fimbrial biogenesis protein FimT